MRLGIEHMSFLKQRNNHPRYPSLACIVQLISENIEHEFAIAVCVDMPMCVLI